MVWLDDSLAFPNYEVTNEDGIIALGGDLSPNRLMLAYRKGIFPWYSEDQPIIWHCPKERMVLFPDELRISKSMKQIMKKNIFSISENKAFDEVIYWCKNIDRADGYGTWITDEMEQAFMKLHKLGFAHSIEVWQNEMLIGGLYGIKIGNVFCGESMFSKVSNASKVAFISLVQNHQFDLIDCQVYNNHLASLGAREISRDEFLQFLPGNIEN